MKFIDLFYGIGEFFIKDSNFHIECDLDSELKWGFLRNSNKKEKDLILCLT